MDLASEHSPDPGQVVLAIRSSPEPQRKPRKRVRRSRTIIPVITPQPCHLIRMPFELLAEVLLNTSSPKDILALARCSKFFCTTLLSPTSAYIWRHARKTCQPQPLPEPLPNFTESSYASFVFDGGICNVCKKWTNASYASYALRIRLCGRSECRNEIRRTILTFPSSYDHYHQKILTWIPVIEGDGYFRPGINYSRTFGTVFCLAADFNKALKEYTEAEKSPESLKAYIAQHKAQANRLKLTKPFYLSVFNWRAEYRKSVSAMKTKNENFAKLLATKEGWQNWDLINSETYGRLHRNRTNILELVHQRDYDAIATTVAAELLKIMESRKRRTEENAYKRRRADVEQHYSRIRSAHTESALPTLSTFRKLPIINVLQSTPTAEPGVTSELKSSSLVQQLLRVQLGNWREQARNVLSATLGYPNWKSASTKKLHPVDRLTARFQCKKCHKVGNRYQEDGSLDFSGACSHQCPHLSKKDRAKEVWTPDQFVKDDKAIAIVSKVLERCYVNPEETQSIETMKKLPDQIMCWSCESAIVMKFDSVVGHSRRHDDMHFSIMTLTESASILTYPIEYGLCKKLMGPSYRAKALQKLQNFGCRHCIQTRKPSEPSDKKPKLLNFNGLRSHLKAKHHVGTPRDEDIYCHEKLEWHIPQPEAEKSIDKDTLPS